MPVLDPAWRSMWKPGSPTSGAPEGSDVRYACEDKTCPAEPMADSARNAENNPKLCPVHEDRGIRKFMNRPVVRA